MNLSHAKYHFIGIGGIGMSGLAELLFNMGAYVQGSDLKDNSQTLELKKKGIKVYIGHHSQHVKGCDVCVYSSAVDSLHVEVVAAREQKIPLIPRAEALAEIMRLKRGLAVAGSHGKTTTTSLIATLMIKAKKDPTVVVGGRLNLIRSNSILGQGEWLIAEADESDGSFSRLSPELVIITNIDNDHLDYFKTKENLFDAFYHFALQIPFYGTLILCGDDKSVREKFKNFPKKMITYGFDEQNDFVLSGREGRYSIHSKQKNITFDFEWGVPGQHNALNATAVALAGLELNLSIHEIQNGLKEFQGVDRRLQLRHQFGELHIIDDYGHHPTEIRATLQALREKYKNKKITVLFQPHRYSRTELLWSDWASSFTEADEVYLSEIYSAGEVPRQNITTKFLLEHFKNSKVSYDVFYFDESEEAFTQLAQKLEADQVVLTLGAGTVTQWPDRLNEKINFLSSLKNR